MKKRYMLRISLLGLSFVLFVAGLYLVLLYVPTEETMGVVQRIFYFHVPLAWVAFLAFFIVFLASILYLRNRDTKWDVLASTSAEVGTLFTTLFLITGSIWARPVWGAWWTWSPRLTTALILWLIYIAYLMVRSFADDRQRGSRFAAVVAIVGFIDVPVVALAIILWRTQHPGPLIFQGGLTTPMLLTLLVCLAAFSALYCCLLVAGISIKNDEIEIGKLKQISD
jgi:heme exporter protein C